MTDGGRNIQLRQSAITDWKITFVDTGLRANIGQRLKAVEKYLEGEKMFLANYSDGLSGFALPDLIDRFVKSGKIASFLCARPSQSFHVVKLEPENLFNSIQSLRKTDILINAGFFVCKKEIFDYMRPGEEHHVESVQRLIAATQIVDYHS